MQGLIPTGQQSALHPAFATPRLFHPERTLFSLFLLDVAVHTVLTTRSWTASVSSFFIIEMIPRSPARPFPIPFYVRIVSFIATISFNSIVARHPAFVLSLAYTSVVASFFFQLFNIHNPTHPPHAPFSGLIISILSLSLAFSTHVPSTAAAHPSSVSTSFLASPHHLIPFSFSFHCTII